MARGLNPTWADNAEYVEIVDGTRGLGIDVRAGIHTGECELVDGRPAGVSVHVGARLAALAQAGEVLVPSTVNDLVAGPGFMFESRGTHELKGVPGQWNVHAVQRPTTVA